MASCTDCGKLLCKENKTGFCRACGNRSSLRRQKNAAGVRLAHSLGIHPGFPADAHTAGGNATKKIYFDRVLQNPSKYTTASLSSLLAYSGRASVCEVCGLATWQNKPLPLEVHHLDGNRNNNDLANLQIICPNCHSQTDSFRGKNLNKGRAKVTDEQLMLALEESGFVISTALRRVGLTPAGGNYERAYRVIMSANTSLVKAN